ncbi:hypothetical protein V7S74_08325 [Aquirufa sp. 2-AUSEE-184A6]|jgi:hypothetical protein|uniref:Aromatic hydrocarbon degradation protein n=1 Tax=Aquirufa novilacunae TaxID=3139305 RepID=A0ABW8SZA3_9BACT
MKKAFILLFSVFALQQAVAQIYTYPSLGKQFSTSYSTGTARMQALGGASSALGADLSALTGNPAGLGFYTRSEVNMSLAYTGIQTKSSYLATADEASESQIQMPTLGMVISSNNLGGGEWHGSFGFGYSRQAIFIQPIQISGTNNRSSLLDNFIEKANDKGATGATLDDEYDSYSGTASSAEALAYQTYLINPNSVTGGTPFERFQPLLPTNQYGTASNSGALTSWDFAYGATYRDQLYLGAALHFSKISSSSSTTWEDEFVGAKNVAGFQYAETLLTNGSGIALSLGGIYKLNPSLRLSLAFRSPTYYDQMNETYDARLFPNVIGIPAIGSTGNPITITKVNPMRLTTNEFTYQFLSPMKVSGGFALFFSKKGFLTADLEYVGYGGMKVYSAELGGGANQAFQTKYNGQIARNFEGALNIKVGSEIRISPSLSVRGGAALFGGGYAASYDTIDRNALQFSGGIGYRKSNFYLDLTAIQRTQKDAYTPYTLKNAADFSSATLDITTTQFMLGGGIYF